MLKGWFGIGVLLAVLGLLLFQKGLSLRLDGGKPVYIPDSVIEERQASALELVHQATPHLAGSTPEGDLHLSGEVDLKKLPANSSPDASIHQERMSGKSPRNPRPALEPPPSKKNDALYKQRLREHLKEKGWRDTDLSELEDYLTDRRISFRLPVLRKIVEHVETTAQYEQHLTPQSLAMCEDFWNRKSDDISRGADPLDFPVEVIVAILKIESNFGKWPGKESIFNVYWSLSLGDNGLIQKEFKRDLKLTNSRIRNRIERRAEWARKQLKDLLYMARIGSCPDPVGIMGSWAGAFGLCQFVPTSYRAFGRDGNDDGVVDLYNVADASASIAYYLVENGWPDSNSPTRKKKAVMRYNISKPYAECVLALADSLKYRLDFLPSVTAQE